MLSFCAGKGDFMINKNGIVLTQSEMKKYVQEWIPNLSTMIYVSNIKTDEADLKMIDVSNGELIFSQHLKQSKISEKDKVVSTSGIIDEELRGLIEQCISLDRQLEESLAKNSSQKQA